jgi:hypothetical protein
MKKKYVIAAPDQNYNPLFYTETIGFLNDVPKIPMSMKKAIVICKNSPLSTWIIEYEFPKLKNIAESFIHTFEDFIKSCKGFGLEVIETRPSIYTASEIESAIPEEQVEYGYIIKKKETGSLLYSIRTYGEGLYGVGNQPESTIIFRAMKEAEFQAKILNYKCKEDYFFVEKVDLNTFFKK